MNLAVNLVFLLLPLLCAHLRFQFPLWATARGRERYPAWPSWRGRKPVARLSPGGPASKFRGQASRGLEFRLRGEAVWGSGSYMETAMAHPGRIQILQ